MLNKCVFILCFEAIMENSQITTVKNIVWTTLNEKATRRTLEWNKQFKCTEFVSRIDQIVKVYPHQNI